MAAMGEGCRLDGVDSSLVTLGSGGVLELSLLPELWSVGHEFGL